MEIKLKKTNLLILIVLLISTNFYCQITVQNYLDQEQYRLTKADSIETDVTSYIQTNLPTYTLSSQALAAITNELTTIHDCEDGPVTGNEAQLIIDEMKRSILRSNYFTNHTNLNGFYTAKIGRAHV